MTQEVGPYARAAFAYWHAGWRGVLPLPAGTKYPPPTGFTGAGGMWPSYADIHAWCDGPEGAGNIALRLPPSVIGIDVDAYAGKYGDATLASFTQRHGPLPAGPWSSSRDDGSRIMLFRIPEGLAWPGEVGPSVEIIQTRHRYVVVPPSIHPSGAEYRWHGADGVPRLDELLLLPDAWVAALTGGRLAVEIGKSDPVPADVTAWRERPANRASACGPVRHALFSVLDVFRSGAGSRHDAALRAVMRLAHLSAEGHIGAADAVEAVERAFYAALGDSRSHDEAHREWTSIVKGALAVLEADGRLGDPDVRDPCQSPLPGILAPSSGDSAATPPGTESITRGAPSESLPGAESMMRAGTPTASPLYEAADGSVDARVDARAQLVAMQAERLRISRDARKIVDDEDAAAGWTAPLYVKDLSEFLAEPDPAEAWRFAEVLPIHANVLLTAQFKSGKTTLINHAVRCLADGVPFLGTYPVTNAGRIGIWNLEVGTAQYRRWLRDVGIMNADAVSILNLRGHTVPLRNPAVRAWVISWLTEHDITVWIIDPFARIFSGNGKNENDNSEVAEFLDLLDDVKKAAGVSELILSTHTGRAVMDVGAERARGATRLDDWADVRWLLTKDNDGTRYFRATGRDVETEEGRLVFDPLTRALSRVEGSRGDGSGELANIIVQCIAMNPGVSARGIREFCRNAGLKARNTTIAEVTQRLVQQAVIRCEGLGVSGSSMHYFMSSNQLNSHNGR